jgi:YD repeat-containing protein
MAEEGTLKLVHGWGMDIHSRFGQKRRTAEAHFCREAGQRAVEHDGGQLLWELGSESRSYNAKKQLTALSSNGVSLQYNYSSSANNGKITSQYDTVSGETVAYTYDSLNRLYTAAATTGGTWSQTYAYEGSGT